MSLYSSPELSDGDEEDNLFFGEVLCAAVSSVPVTVTEAAVSVAVVVAVVAAVVVAVPLAVFDPAVLTPLTFVVALAPEPAPEPAPEAKKPWNPRSKVDSVEAIVVRGTLGGVVDQGLLLRR